MPERHYQVISADGHVETPPDPWVRYVPEKWKDRAPRLIELPDGGEGWIVEGQPLLKNGQNITGRGPISFSAASYYWEKRGGSGGNAESSPEFPWRSDHVSRDDPADEPPDHGRDPTTALRFFG